MRNFTSIYTYWAFNSKKFLKKLPTYMWPMCTHVVQLQVNYNSTKNELTVNYELAKNELKMN
jgi:hypothetical protein